MVSLTVRTNFVGERTSLSRIASFCHLSAGGTSTVQVGPCCRMPQLQNAVESKLWWAWDIAPQGKNSTPWNLISCTKVLKLLYKITFRLCVYVTYEVWVNFMFRLSSHIQTISCIFNIKKKKPTHQKQIWSEVFQIRYPLWVVIRLPQP